MYIARNGYKSTSGWLGDIWSGIKKVGGTGLELLKPPTVVVQQPQSSMPDWLLPVMLGGGVLVAVVMLAKKKKSVPAAS